MIEYENIVDNVKGCETIINKDCGLKVTLDGLIRRQSSEKIIDYFTKTIFFSYMYLKI